MERHYDKYDISHVVAHVKSDFSSSFVSRTVSCTFFMVLLFYSKSCHFFLFSAEYCLASRLLLFLKNERQKNMLEKLQRT